MNFADKVKKSKVSDILLKYRWLILAFAWALSLLITALIASSTVNYLDSIEFEARDSLGLDKYQMLEKIAVEEERVMIYYYLDGTEETATLHSSGIYNFHTQTK